ncbi:hypothetical protein ACQEU3_44600 [Spirillospora sp. CA-253888]
MRKLPAVMLSTTLPTALAAGVMTAAAPTASPAPPPPPSAATARSHLAALTVTAEGPTSGYARDKFPHWTTVSGACDTRKTVLKRDGTGMVQNSSCAATSGIWRSPYDGATWTAASDIDHMVPLAEAWRSGASAWTTARRQQFATAWPAPNCGR